MDTHLPDDPAAGDDLSALAWVQDELRRSLEPAHKALRRYLKEAEAVGGSDLDAVDPALLRAARTQMHQGVGALELVGLPAAAALLRASEAAVQRFIARPQADRRARRSRRSSGPRSRCSTTSRRAGGQGRCRRWRCSRSTAPCRSWPAPSACTRPTCGRSTGAGASCRADAGAHAAPADAAAARRARGRSCWR